MLITTILAMSLIGDSLTISPLGITYHGPKADQLDAQRIPRKLDSSGKLTWHPELNLIYKTKYWQFTGFYFRDTFDTNAGGIALGPKYDVFSWLSIGVVGGAYAREYQTYRKGVFSKKLLGVEIQPIIASTLAIKVPITKKVSFEVNTASNVVITHSVGGIRLDF